ncbi:uncharacterized protein LOC124698577 [Lolium rigidum]|uniref:uncharacterized protein LOC124698577 n=1 Tax=Lolium rigidum TaxID=89674 RepID=UPI001F5C8FF4|nr:uncharacterized protein LOC124698577 [Lolium rigidum]
MDKPFNDQENNDPNVQQTNEFFSAAKLKKKEVPSKNLRRKKNWLDKLFKGKRKPTKVSASKNKGAKQEKKHDGVESQVGAEKKDGSGKGANVELHHCNPIMSFTELLTTPSYGVYGEDMF